MIVATSTSWTRGEYVLTDPDGSGEPFGEVSLRVFGGGRLTVGAVDFDIETSHWTQTTYSLLHDGRRLVRAQRPSLWRRQMEIDIEPEMAGGTSGLELFLAPQGWLGREWTLHASRVSGGRLGLEVGHAVWTKVLKGRLDATFDEALPLAVQAFVVAVLVLERRRQGRQAS